MPTGNIPFDAINAAALVQLPSLLRGWFPHGKREGHEWRVGSINGEAGESFSVNMQTGKWGEFNGLGAKGGDVISLYAAKFCNGKQGEAARTLAEELGIDIKRSKQKPKSKPQPDEEQWIALIPPPPDAGPPPDAMLSGFDMVHRYTSLDGRETHFVGRVEARANKRKQFIPITYGELNGVRGWHKRAPDGPRPLYGLNKLAAMPEATVILCEGEKAADAAQRLFPDYACLSWFGGNGQVEHADLAPLATRSVIVWPDADASGLVAMRKLLRRLPAETRVVRTDGLPEKFDAADLEHQGCDDPAAWLNKRLVADAEKVTLPRGFSFNARGLWYQPPSPASGEAAAAAAAVWICKPFEILARTSDDAHHNHGLLLQWSDADKERHSWAMPRRLVHADGNAIAAELEDAGLSCNPSRLAHERLKQCLGAVIAHRRVRCVDRAGWHGATYVLPDGRVFGADPDGIVMQTEHVVAGDAYAARGTLADWRDGIARYAVGNDLLALLISAAFDASLLDIVGEPSGGIHTYGASKTGKTTLVRCKISVWGPGDGGLFRTWRATANGLEAVFAETNDGPLTLDELGMANPREVGEVIYTAANGVGKARATRAGGARTQRTWRISWTSTGEIPLAAKLSEAGLRSRAGLEARMAELPADAGAGMGVWQDLHEFSSGAALSDHLREASRTCCGTAGPAYLDQLARDRTDDAEALATTLRGLRDQFLKQHVPSDADGQVRSVAARFALIGAAGELATEYGITGWPEGEAMRATAACFKRWLETRGGAGAAEDKQAVEAVRSFIALHGNSRFETVVMKTAWDPLLKREVEKGEEVEPRTVINRAGWRRKDEQGGWEYRILPSIWRTEICNGLDSGRVAEVLAKQSMLVGWSKRHPAAAVRIPGHKRLRLYRVLGTILNEDTPDGE